MKKFGADKTRHWLHKDYIQMDYIVLQHKGETMPPRGQIELVCYVFVEKERNKVSIVLIV